jgi:hypothetical protein
MPCCIRGEHLSMDALSQLALAGPAGAGGFLNSAPKRPSE